MADKKAFMEKKAHEAFIRPEIGDLLYELEAQKSDLSDEVRFNDRRLLVERLVFCYRRAKALKPDFVERKSRATSEANTIWEQAKHDKDFSIFVSPLQKVIEIVKEEAWLYGAGDSNSDSLYTALLQGYEPGMTAQRAREILCGAHKWLSTLLPKIQGSSIKPFDEELAKKVLRGIFPRDRQRLLAEAAVRAIGYDFQCGNLAETEHPFMITVGPGDHRITTKFVEDYLAAAFFGEVHEGGHAGLEQGRHTMLNWADNYAFVISMGIHESQSRLWENVVGRSPYFWLYFYPILQAIFPKYYGIPQEDFFKAINVVKPSPIRIYADEVTYNLHILIRFEIEIALLSGELPVEDLPAAFAQKMEEYLGIKPDDVAQGVLQDIHWAIGYIGYFPSYTFGNQAAAQLFAKFQELHPEWQREFSRGNFRILLDWLRENVHPLAYLETLDSMLQRVTGEPLNPEHWVKYIEEKFCPIYQISPGAYCH